MAKYCPKDYELMPLMIMSWGWLTDTDENTYEQGDESSTFKQFLGKSRRIL